MSSDKSWVVIWVSNWCKAEGILSGVYHNQQTAEDDARKENLKDNTRKFYVVEYESKEHRHALMQSRKNPFQ